MITYNKELGVWDFKEATQDEKAVLASLGEAVWAQSMALAIAKEWMRQAAEEEGVTPDYDGPPRKQVWEEHPVGSPGNVLTGDFPKKAH